MVLSSLHLTAAVMPVSAAVCSGVQAVARRLLFGPSAERITAADRRWLAGQRTDLPR
jgi:hypothetical protein